MAKSTGATLMELIVVVAIIAILAGVGYPSYIKLQQQARRADAHSSILATAAIVERYLAENNKANIDSGDMALSQFENFSVSSGTPALSSGEYYVITIVPDSTGYSVNATATAAGALNDCGSNTTKQCGDTQCRIISLDHGAKESTNSSGGVANAASTICW